MIDYVIISLAVLCFVAQFAFTKVYEKNSKQTVVSSMSLLIFTSVVGAIIYLFVSGFKVQFSPFSFWMALAFALVMIPYYIVSVKVLSLGSLAVYSLFMMLGGMILPFFYGIAFLSEQTTWGKILGCVLLTASMVLQTVGQSGQQSNNKQKDKRKRLLFLVLCVVIFIVNGLTCVIAKAHQINLSAINESSFMVWSCLLTVVFGGIILLFNFIKKGGKDKVLEFKGALKMKSLLIISAIGAVMYTGNFLHLIAADSVPASVQFPMVSGGVIVLSALVSAIVFKEKLTKIEWISIVGAFLSTVLFAF